MKKILKDKFIDKGSLSYRRGVVGIIIDNLGNFLLVQMISYGDGDWRFPGGGVNYGEGLEIALLRELEEELGSTNFKILKRSPIVNKYDWPDSVIISRLKKNGKTWKGQEQSQFLVKFTGQKKELNPNPSEIRRIKWVKRDQLKNYFNFSDQLESAEKALASFGLL